MKQLLMALLIGLPFVTLRAETRTWTSTAGSKLEAEFAGLIQGKVMLKKSDGTSLALALEQLSEMDQAYIKDETGAGDYQEVENETASGNKERLHRLTIVSSGNWTVVGELEGTYEVKNGSLEIEIKKGFVEPNPGGAPSKKMVTRVVLSVAKKNEKSFSTLASSEEIPVNEVLEIGDKFHLEPQKLLIKHDSISAENPEELWILAAIELELEDERTARCYLHSEYYCGTRKSHPYSPRR